MNISTSLSPKRSRGGKPPVGPSPLSETAEGSCMFTDAAAVLSFAPLLYDVARFSSLPPPLCREERRHHCDVKSTTGGAVEWWWLVGDGEKLGSVQAQKKKKGGGF